MATDGKGEAEATESKKTCFVVCPIGGDVSPERKHSNQVYKYIISPVLEAAGFAKPMRSDMISEGGNISRQIINRILEDDLVIADLTGKNPNVYYELAIRHCVAKPFIQLISKGETIPFDISQQRTIFFDRTDLDSVEATKLELAQHVASAMADGARVDTPIGAALDFEKLRSGTDTDQLLSVLIDKVDRIGRRVPFVPPDRTGKDNIRFLVSRFARGTNLSEGQIENIIKATWDYMVTQAERGVRLAPADELPDFIKARLEEAQLTLFSSGSQGPQGSQSWQGPGVSGPQGPQGPSE